MGYYRKTCSYCRGNHANLDCKKLIEDAEKAQKEIDAWTDEDDLISQRADRLYWEYTWDRPTDTYRITEPARSRLATRYPLLWGNPQDIKLCITKEEKDKIQNDRYKSKSRFERTVRENAEVREKEAKRAAKSCSYCRGKGHTVRTCSQKKTDVKTLEDWRLIDSYLKAKALSRAGIWTAAMIVVPKDPDWEGAPLPNKAYTLEAKEILQALRSLSIYRGFVKQDPTGGYGHSPEPLSEDDLHEAVIHGALSNLSFSNPAYGERRNYDTIGSWYLEHNRVAGLHMGQGYTSPDGYGKPFFMRTHIAFEHIFKLLVQRDLPELLSKDTYRRTHGQLVSRYALHPDDPRRASTQPSHNCGQLEFSEKKKRLAGDWVKIEKFIKQNKSILNKAKRLNV